MRRLMLCVVFLAACSAPSLSVAVSPSSASVGPSITTSAPCPANYPSSKQHSETVWEGRTRIVTITSASDGLFSVTLLSDPVFTTDPLRLHFVDPNPEVTYTFAGLGLAPGDVVRLRLYARGDDCSYQARPL